jgi:hypothetical protein
LDRYAVMLYVAPGSCSVHGGCDDGEMSPALAKLGEIGLNALLPTTFTNLTKLSSPRSPSYLNNNQTAFTDALFHYVKLISADKHIG